jgi:signal peptide peptidase SppA
MNLFSDISGGVTFEAIRQSVRVAIADPNIRSIVLDIDSPGGSVAGASECARAILEARYRKPIVACCEYQACSAAYWLASCATEVIAPPSAQVGSIGVFTIHEDLSRMLDQLGVDTTVISAGKYKTEALPFAPLSAEAKARVQRQVNQAYGMFVADVAAGRGVTEASVRGGFGQGAVVSAADAMAAGMINRIESLDDCLARVVTTPPQLAPVRQPAAMRAEPVRPSRLDYFKQQHSARALRAAR